MCYSKPIKQNLVSYRIAQQFNRRYNINKRYIRGTANRLQKTLNDIGKHNTGYIKVGIGKGIWRVFRVSRNPYKRVDIARAYRNREPVRYKRYKKFYRRTR